MAAFNYINSMYIYIYMNLNDLCFHNKLLFVATVNYINCDILSDLSFVFITNFCLWPLLII